MNTEQQYRNALADETSPYLLQHAHNPVNWYPWGPHSLALAQQQDKPILLSIGYSACHWCHVMAHESFEDPATAEVMNALFINIKVDREERPDLDKIYQTAHQLLAGRPGGWPLTVMLSPGSQIPFFAGTYFPREQRYGMPAFTDLLRRIVGLYRERHDQLQQQNASLTEAMSVEHRLGIGDTGAAGVQLSSVPLDQVRRQLDDSFDDIHAGFGAAPKFPHPTSLNRLLRHFSASRAHGHSDERAWEMLDKTLTNIARGGVYDQLGGGFFRYSVDALWMIPHFEKMLYDNAQLLGLYAEAWAARPDGESAALYQSRVRETADWVMRDMQAADGGYWSTLDADTEGGEGSFYVWTRQQVRELLDDDEYPLIAGCFGLDRDANFEAGWHLHGYQTIAALSAHNGADVLQARALLDRARAKLLRARSQRVAPGRDEKVLTAWNGLMIRGMAVAGRVFELPELIASAERALGFVRQTLWQDGQLLATSKDGQARLAAYLDDHAFMIDALLALLEVRWNRDDMDFAIMLANRLLDGFEDRERGGFFFTANDHESLFHRPKPFGDDALPAGNAVAARCLSRLGHLLGEPRYLQAAEDTVKAAWPLLSQAPMGHEAMLDALQDQLQPPAQLILRANDATARRWRAALRTARIDCPIYVLPPDANDLPAMLALKQPEGECIAYLCHGQRCSPPLYSVQALVAALSQPV
jgi:hypothetical protein